MQIDLRKPGTDDFHQHGILGTSLRNEAFKTLREQYPLTEIEPETDTLETQPVTNE